MENIKLAIIYYSMTGTNYQLAKWAAEAAVATGAEVRLLKVKELAPKEAIESSPAWKAYTEASKDVPEVKSDDLDWADAIIFSTPTRFGEIASQMKQFIDTQGGLWAAGKLNDKVVSAMASAGNPHGGQEGTIKAIYTVMMHWGAIIAAPGYTDDSVYAAGGNPYGTSVTQSGDGSMAEDVRAAVYHQAKRTLKIAGWIKKGKE